MKTKCFEKSSVRSKPADEVCPRVIRHQGWYCDSIQSEVFRPYIILLPHGRFLAAYSEPWNDYLVVDVDGQCVYTTERDAALAADDFARIAAEQQIEYEVKENTRIEAEDRAYAERALAFTV